MTAIRNSGCSSWYIAAASSMAYCQEDCPQHQTVSVFSSSDVPCSFSVPNSPQAPRDKAMVMAVISAKILLFIAPALLFIPFILP